jgi:hypothetical protein
MGRYSLNVLPEAPSGPEPIALVMKAVDDIGAEIEARRQQREAKEREDRAFARQKELIGLQDTNARTRETEQYNRTRADQLSDAEYEENERKAERIRIEEQQGVVGGNYVPSRDVVGARARSLEAQKPNDLTFAGKRVTEEEYNRLTARQSELQNAPNVYQQYEMDKDKRSMDEQEAAGLARMMTQYKVPATTIAQTLALKYKGRLPTAVTARIALEGAGKVAPVQQPDAEGVSAIARSVAPRGYDVNVPEQRASFGALYEQVYGSPPRGLPPQAEPEPVPDNRGFLGRIFRAGPAQPARPGGGAAIPSAGTQRGAQLSAMMATPEVTAAIAELRAQGIFDETVIMQKLRDKGLLK